ncbi:MAG TPA: matrixin family metalloprotease [Polyangia bacterium]|nr:matrixin family metalloprotease [Polyangia bacterium]
MNTASHRNTAANTPATLALLATLALAAAPAAAYETQETADGNPVRWGTAEVVITLDGSISGLGPTPGVEEAIVSAFERWVAEADLPLDFTLVQGDCGEPGFHQGESNENCVMARHLGEDSGHTGATTRLSYSSPSGDIVDGDIVFNLDAGHWGLDGEPEALDIFEVSLHEVGHLLGLAHSDVEEARMYSTMGFGPDGDGGLHEDDIAGAGELYADLEATIETLTCSVATPGATTPSLEILLATLLAGAGIWTIRRKIR